LLSAWSDRSIMSAGTRRAIMKSGHAG
jgi:hypothetical protein